MIRPISASAALLCALALPAMAETKDYTVPAFDGLDVRTGITVNFEEGPAQSISVEQADGDFSDIEISVEDGNLLVVRVSGRDGRGWYKNVKTRNVNGELVVKVGGKRKPTYVVTVTAPDLKRSRVSNSSVLNIAGLEADKFVAKASSSGAMAIVGRADVLEASVSSSGDIVASDLNAGALSLTASSSGDLIASADGGDVDASVSSSGDIYISGTCGKIDISASSSGDIKARDLTCETAKVRASSSANVSVFATGSLDASASSSGDINAYGNPTAKTIKTSSSGDIDLR